MTRRTLVAASLAAAGVAAAAVAPGSSGQSAPAPLTLDMRHEEAKVTMLDEAPRMTKKRPSESPGDSVVSHGVLRDSTGARVGAVHGQFVVTSGRSPDTTEHVLSTFVLAGGQIAAQGVIDQEGDSESVAIVGGTGQYDGATGSIEITGDDKSVRFTLKLRP